VSALLASELLKVRTTRGWYAYLLVIVLFGGLAAAAEIGSAEDARRSTLEFQVGLIEGRAIPDPAAPPTTPAAPAAPAPAPPGRVGEAIGILERLLIVTLVLAGAEAAIGLVIAAKTLARFKQLDDRDFAEYYLLGTLASVAVATISAFVAVAALDSLG